MKQAHVFHTKSGVIGIVLSKAGRCRSCGVMHFTFRNRHGETRCIDCDEKEASYEYQSTQKA